VRERLKKKNASNLLTMFISLAYDWFISVFACLILHYALQPLLCSIYDEDHWRHERFRKLSLHEPILLLNGTPFKNLVWRAPGVRIGKKVFDGGAVIPERTFTTMVDFCTLDEGCVLQGHSFEDGICKRDRLVIGEGCTIGARALVHHGVFMGPDTALESNAFLMKGERPMANSVWGGNPVQEVQMEQPLPDRSRAAMEAPAAALAACRARGIVEPGPVGFLGGCDLVHFQRVGIRGVVLGPGSLEQAHQPDEYVALADLVRASLIYRDLALDWFSRQRN
jgi:Peptidase family M20/M25/M40